MNATWRLVAYLLVALAAGGGAWRLEQTVQRIDEESETRSMVTCARQNQTRAETIQAFDLFITELGAAGEATASEIASFRDQFVVELTERLPSRSCTPEALTNP